MTIFTVIFPVFAIALAGYLSARFKILDQRDVEGISKFVFAIAIPILLFNSLADVTLPEEINWQFWLSYYLISLLIYAVAVWISHRWFGHTPREQAIFGLGASYSNMVLVGLPIISTGLGEDALLPIFLLISIHSATLFFVVTLLVERGDGNGLTVRQVTVLTLKNLSRNPIIIGLMSGLAFNLLKIPIPTMVDDALGTLGDAALPCAIFVLGASLNAYKLAGHFREAWAMIGLKMVVHPLLVAVMALAVFHLDPLWAAVAVMMAGMPVGVNSFIFAQKYQAGIAVTSTAILISTLLAVVSQSLLLAIFIPRT
ncbi:MAG TPA: AEC family transporter [Anaerolineales bacterium]|nr:AEC family transporter [Anaerolineales bacterium]